MSKAKLFEYAIMVHADSKEVKKTGVKSKLITKVNHIVATDEKQAAILAAREIPDQYLSNLDNVEVLIRPF